MVTTCFGLYHQAIIRLEAETCCHHITLNKINIYNTGCVLTFLLTWITLKTTGWLT